MTPDVLKSINFEENLNEYYAIIKTKIPNYKISESDVFSIMLQSMCYKEMMINSAFNKNVNAFFLHTATGNDLDMHGFEFGLNRLLGSYPIAQIEFKLKIERNFDLMIPAKTIFYTTDNSVAKLINDVFIKKGELLGLGYVELEEYLIESDKIVSSMQTPISFLDFKQIGEFKDGKIEEGDEVFRERIYLALSLPSTAGSENAYDYYATSADSRIKSVKTFSDDDAIVKIIFDIDEKEYEEIIRGKILKAVNDEFVRPLTDKVEVYAVKKIMFDIDVEIMIDKSFDILSINSILETSFREKLIFKIGENVETSNIISIAHISSSFIKRVKLNNFTDIEVEKDSIAMLRDININVGIYYE